MSAECIMARDRAIRGGLRIGLPVATVAESHSVSEDVVRRIAMIAAVDDDGGAIFDTRRRRSGAAYQPCPEAAAVLDDIGWRIDHHLPSPGPCTTRDAALCDSLIAEDLTLDQVGARAEVTRERVRQIVLRHTGLSARDLVAYRKDVREARQVASGRAAVDRVVAEQPDATINDLVRASGLTRGEVNEVLGRDDALRRRARNTWTRGVAVEDVLSEIRRVAALPGGTPLSGRFYDEQRLDDAISAIRISQRFGSWREACARVDVPVTVIDRTYSRRWAEDELLDWVKAYVDVDGVTRASYRRMTAWLMDHGAQGAPSAQTVRNYLGRWTDILTAVAERQ